MLQIDFLPDIIFGLGAVCDWLMGAIAEAFCSIFDGLVNVLTHAVELKGNYYQTFEKMFFQAPGTSTSGTTTMGLFANSEIFTDVIVKSKTDQSYFLKIFRFAAQMLILLFTVMNLFKGLFGNLIGAEPPHKIIGRAMMFTLIIGTYELWTQGLLSLVFSPIYTTLASDKKTESVFDNMFNAKSEAIELFIKDGSMSPSDALSFVFLPLNVIKIIVLLIALFPIGIQIIKMVLEIVERFTLLFFQLLFGPLCLACGTSPTTSNIAQKWFTTYIGAHIGLIINVFFIKLSMSALSAWAANYANPNPKEIFNIVIQYCIVYSMFKIGCEADQHMARLGLDMLQAGGLQAAMFGGLAAGKNAILGRGGAGGGGGAFNSSAMRAAAAGGSKAAAVASKVGGHGLLGNAIGAAAVAGSALTKNKTALAAAAGGTGFGSMVAGAALAASNGLTPGITDNQKMSNVASSVYQDMVSGKAKKIKPGSKEEQKYKEFCSATLNKDVSSCSLVRNNDGTSSLKATDAKTGEVYTMGLSGTQDNALHASMGGYDFDVNTNSAENRGALADSISGVSAVDSVAANTEGFNNYVSQDNDNIVECAPEEASQSDLVNASSANTFTTEECKDSSGHTYQAGEAVPLAISGGQAISCNEKGTVTPNGNYVKTITGAAVPKASLTSQNGEIQTFKGVGSQVLCEDKNGIRSWQDAGSVDSANYKVVTGANNRAITGDAKTTINLSELSGQAAIGQTTIGGVAVDEGSIQTGVSFSTDQNNVAVVSDSANNNFQIASNDQGQPVLRKENGNVYAQAQGYKIDSSGVAQACDFKDATHVYCNGQNIEKQKLINSGALTGSGEFVVNDAAVSQQLVSTDGSFKGKDGNDYNINDMRPEDREIKTSYNVGGVSTNRRGEKVINSGNITDLGNGMKSIQCDDCNITIASAEAVSFDKENASMYGTTIDSSTGDKKIINVETNYSNSQSHRDSLQEVIDGNFKPGYTTKELNNGMMRVEYPSKGKDNDKKPAQVIVPANQLNSNGLNSQGANRITTSNGAEYCIFDENNLKPNMFKKDPFRKK